MRSLAKSRGDLPENWLALADNFDRAVAARNIYRAREHYTLAMRAWSAATGEPFYE